jgi:phage terminase small subunit
MSLTPRQQRFAEEYLVDLNATRAALRAGYSAKGAEVRGSELLRNRKVAAKIDGLKRERSERTRVTADRVLRELAVLAFSSIEDYALDDDGRIVLRPGAEPDALRAVRRIRFKKRPVAAILPRRRHRATTCKCKSPPAQVEVETDICLWDKLAALKLCMDHLGLRQALTLETVLSLLPRELADELRRHLASPARPEDPPTESVAG